jgi:hypothetical protein
MCDDDDDDAARVLMMQGAAAAAALLRGVQCAHNDEAVDDDEGPPPSRQGQGPRDRPTRLPTSQTKWWRMIKSEHVRDPRHREGKRFRKRFRVSFNRFVGLVDDARSWVDTAGRPVFARPLSVNDARTIFVEVKVLMALRWIATGNDFDSIAEMADVSETAARVSCLKWCSEFARSNRKEWLSPPTGEILEEELRTYARMGLPGCLFSCDVVHIAWDQCPSQLRSMFAGKEGSG